MPSENRNIYFSEAELKIALSNFSARKQFKFNSANINEMKIDEKDAVNIQMRVYNSDNGHIEPVEYNYSEIAASLIGYCMRHGIPLPKSGKKAIKPNATGMYLTVKVDV